jgi:hypothetical protein
MGLGSSKVAVDVGDRILLAGRPELDRCDNRICTSKYTMYNFLPIVRTSATTISRDIVILFLEGFYAAERQQPR